jgi:hypothetical protein
VPWQYPCTAACICSSAGCVLIVINSSNCSLDFILLARHMSCYCDAGHGLGVSELGLPHIIAAAKPKLLQEVLCNCMDGLPFLLQPLIEAPALVQVRPSHAALLYVHASLSKPYLAESAYRLAGSRV